VRTTTGSVVAFGRSQPRCAPSTNGAATKRIVYLTDQLGIDLHATDELVASFTSGYSPLDPTRPVTGSTDSTYRLRINVEPAMLEPTES
jgi:Predicted transcriptional regulator